MLVAPWAAAIIGFLAYANTLQNDYTYDDVPIVKESPRIQEPGRLREIWTTDYWYDARDTAPNRDLLYRPVTLTSICLARTMAGPSPLPQRLVNIFLHATISALFVVCCRFLGARTGVALGLGILFAALPIHSEVVNSVVGRADLFVTLFTLFAMGFHVRAMNAGNARISLLYFATAATCAFLAMASKEIGIVAALLILVADIGQSKFGSSKSRAWKAHGSFKRTAYLVIPCVMYLALRYNALEGQFSQGAPATPTINAMVAVSPFQRLLGPLQLWGMYWEKTFWPIPLTIKYTIPTTSVATSIFNAQVMLGLGTLVALLVLAKTALRRGDHAPAFLLAATLICYFPTSNSLVLIQEFFAERFWYFPSFFALACIACLMTIRTSREIGAVAIASVLTVGMLIRCWIRNAEWKDNGTLYAAAYHSTPHAVGILQLYGDWLTRNADLTRGIELLNRALQVDPGYVDAHRSLAHAYLQAGNDVAATSHLETVARLAPTAAPLNNLGVSYARQGNLAKAEETFRQALSDSKAAPFAHYNLGLICYRTNRVAEAVNHLEQSLRLDPTTRVTYDDLARLYVTLGQTADALRIFQAGTQRFPTDPRYWRHVAVILATSSHNEIRNGTQALEAAGRANELTGGKDPAVLVSVAAAMAELGDFSAARDLAGRALQLLGPNASSSQADEINRHLASYERGSPYRDPRF